MDDPQEEGDPAVVKDVRYEVAISFLSQDEALAVELADRLREQVREVFVYSEAQKEIAATDGMETFRSVFGDDSRVVVVLYREGWGETKWTGVEEDAIKDRGLRTRWESIVVVPLDSPPKCPNWLPETYLWPHFETFGLNGIVPIVLREVLKAGGRAREETATERAERLGRQAKGESDRKKRRESAEGVQAAITSVDGLFEALQRGTADVNAATDQFGMVFRKRQTDTGVVETHWATIHVYWGYSFGNSLEGSGLRVRELDGNYDMDLNPTWPGDPVRNRNTRKFDLVLDDTEAWLWEERRTHRRFTSEALAQDLLRSLLDRTDYLMAKDRRRK